jgi:hypothetical protein
LTPAPKTPGWYPDPREPADFDRRRDGKEWTDHVRKTQGAGIVGQFRRLPLVVKLGIPLLLLGAIFVASHGSSHSVETVQQAESRFKEWAKEKGVTGPVREVRCTPRGTEDFSCSGYGPNEEGVAPLLPSLRGTVEPDGTVIAE